MKQKIPREATGRPFFVKSFPFRRGRKGSCKFKFYLINAPARSPLLFHTTEIFRRISRPIMLFGKRFTRDSRCGCYAKTSGDATEIRATKRRKKEKKKEGDRRERESCESWIISNIYGRRRVPPRPWEPITNTPLCQSSPASFTLAINLCLSTFNERRLSQSETEILACL